jgi:hypothetical protein
MQFFTVHPSDPVGFNRSAISWFLASTSSSTLSPANLSLAWDTNWVAHGGFQGPRSRLQIEGQKLLIILYIDMLRISKIWYIYIHMVTHWGRPRGEHTYILLLIINIIIHIFFFLLLISLIIIWMQLAETKTQNIPLCTFWGGSMISRWSIPNRDRMNHYDWSPRPTRLNYPMICTIVISIKSIQKARK